MITITTQQLNPLVSGGKGITLLNFNTTTDGVAACCFFKKKYIYNEAKLAA
jgi:hypothetical protein